MRHLSEKIVWRRRSLIPFVGQLLGGLFGVVTEEQLEVVKGQVQSLVEKQADIVHAIEESVSVLNVTRVELAENRHAINTITEVTRELRSRMEGATDQIVNTLLPFRQFVLTYFQIQLQLGELRDSVSRATTYITRIEMRLSHLSLGHLTPTILPPLELQTMLLAVREKIPPGLMLPSDPVKGLWHFYMTLHCSAMVHDDNIIILVSLPLLDSGGQFEVYQVLDMPVPYLATNLTASYDLEFRNFGISKDRTRYIVLNNEDMAKCGLEKVKFCSINSPIYGAHERQTCVISLFLRNAVEASTLCQTKVSAIKLPQAQRQDEENWSLAMTKVIVLTLLCKDDYSYEVQVEPPIALLYVPPGCTAFSTAMTLPVYVSGRTDFGVKEPERSLLRRYNNSVLDIWEPLREPHQVLDPINIPPELGHIKDMPLDRLFRQLQRYNEVPTWTVGGFSYRAGLAIGAAVIFMFTVVTVVCRRRLQRFIENCVSSLQVVCNPANGVADEQGVHEQGISVNRLGPSPNARLSLGRGEAVHELAEVELMLERRVGSTLTGAEGTRSTVDALQQGRSSAHQCLP